MKNKLKWLFCWEGRVTRTQYFVAGTLLVLLKYAIDSNIAARYGLPWKMWYYLAPPSQSSLWDWGLDFYANLWAAAIPFFWIGINLTVRRLRDAGHSPRWALLFFVPFVNFVLFTWLSVALPATPAAAEKITHIRPLQSDPALAICVGLPALLGFVLVLLSAQWLALYAWGLFLGVPFLLGFVSAMLLNARALHSQAATVAVGLACMLVTAAALIGFAWEGLGCLVMAVPLALPFVLAGSAIGWSIQASKERPPTPTLAAWVFLVPLMMLGEHAAHLQPPVLPVVTSVTINAPAEVVWKKVIAFSPIEGRREWLFQTGIAYPKSAKIVGSGPGATRYCRFSTGDFVEPIRIWDENRLLAFDVASEPPSMHELSPWEISPPHLEHNFMRSRRGQFKLVAMDASHTLLEGTTWYQDYFWPQAYWRALSDAIIHRIHAQVLQHVKEDAEKEYAARRAALSPAVTDAGSGIR